MNWVTSQQMVRAYLNGYLSDRELEDFLNHVQTCPDCFDELEVYFSIYRTLNDVDEKGDYNFKKKLRRKLEGSRAYLRRRNQSKAFKAALILTAEFALVAALWGIVTFSNIHLEWPFSFRFTGKPAAVEQYEESAAPAADEYEETAAVNADETAGKEETAAYE